jgi:hypothetical protein
MSPLSWDFTLGRLHLLFSGGTIARSQLVSNRRRSDEQRSRKSLVLGELLNP